MINLRRFAKLGLTAVLVSSFSLSPLLTHKAFALPPETTILTTPISPDTDPTPTFTFDSDDPAATFECSIDLSVYVACASPFTPAPLSVGIHTFRVQAINLAAETDPTPDEYAWKIVAFDGGNGTSIDPYQISTCDQWLAMRANLTSHFALIADVDCSGVSYSPIGTSSAPFEGSLDGQGYRVSDIIYSGGSYSSLLGYVAHSTPATPITIKDLKVENVYIIGTSNVGTLAGFISQADVSNIRIQGSAIEATGNNVGGLFGQISAGIITTSSFVGTVNSSASNVGGLVGYSVGPVDTNNSYSQVTIGGADDVGGLVGFLDIGAGSSVSHSYAIASFTTTTGTRSGTVAHLTPSTSEFDNFTVNNLSGTMADGSVYQNTSTYVPLNTWSFGPGNTWHVNYDGYPSLTPLGSPAISCGAPYQSIDSILSVCTHTNQGWGTTIWEAEYRTVGSTDWIPATLSDIHFGEAFVMDTSPYVAYEMRLRFSNDFGVSSWQVVTFSVLDTDNDGSPDAMENYVNGDADSSGVGDSFEANVYGLMSPVNDKYLVLKTASCADNYNLQIGAESSSAADALHDYPTGLVSFVARGCGVGAAVPVEIYFFGDYDVSNVSLRKTKTAAGAITYASVPDVTFNKIQVDGQSVLKASYVVVDGGALDDDGAADGNIVDPVGLAIALAGAPKTGIHPRTDGRVGALFAILGFIVLTLTVRRHLAIAHRPWKSLLPRV